MHSVFSLLISELETKDVLDKDHEWKRLALKIARAMTLNRKGGKKKSKKTPALV
jgi:hypothetical protein